MNTANLIAESASFMREAAWYHRDGASRPLIVEIESERLKRLRRLMQPDVTLEQSYTEINDLRNRPTPDVVLEAVMFVVRSRGLAALREPATLERLERCDRAARAQINQQIEKVGLKP
jgi:hypothetical protein